MHIIHPDWLESLPFKYPDRFCTDDTKPTEGFKPAMIEMKSSASHVILSYPFDDKILSVTRLSINGSHVSVSTHTHSVQISGGSCCSCCDNYDDSEEEGCSKTDKYKRHTLSSVFNKLEEIGELPDQSKLLELWYINRHKDDEHVVSEGKNDAWWYNYISQNYKHVNFVSCTLFDDEKSYSLYTRNDCK